MSYRSWEDTDNTDTDESTQDVDWGGRDGIIFLVDSTELMFRRDSDEEQTDSEMFFRTALRCCHTTMLKKIISSQKDLVAVVLVGTVQMQNDLTLDHLYVLQHLEQPNAEKIKELDKMIKSDSFDNFSSKFGHSSNYNLQDVLWLCQFMFSNCEQKMTTQRILFFTANDDPTYGDRAEQQRALDRANNLRELNIFLELLPFGIFDVKILYKDLVEAAMGEDYAEQTLINSGQNMEELLLRVCRYSHKKRSRGRNLLYLGPKLAIGVGVFTLVRRHPMPKKMWLERTTNLPVKPRTQHFNADTGEVVPPMDIVKFKQYGGVKVVVKPNEADLIANIAEPGFQLMGFKPKDSVKPENHISKPYFIFPDENQVKGSRKLFAALLKKCVEHEKVMICWGVLRRLSPPKLFAFFPQLEVLNEAGIQQIPCGFHAFPLPLSANIRHIDLQELPEVDGVQEQYMDTLVSKLTFHYNVHDFQNPSLETLWAGVEALALETTCPRTIEDNTKPKTGLICQKMDEIGSNHEEVFGNEHAVDLEQPGTSNQEGKKGGKRLADGDGARKTKEPKMDNINVAEMAQAGKVSHLKVDQLRSFLKERGQRGLTGLKKGDLVDLVYKELNVDAP